MRDTQLQIEGDVARPRRRKRVENRRIMGMDLPEQGSTDVKRLTRLKSALRLCILSTSDLKPEDGMHDLTCLIKGCQAKSLCPSRHSQHLPGALPQLSHLASPQRPADVYEVCRDDDGRTRPPRRRMGQHHPRRRSPHRLSTKNLTLHAVPPTKANWPTSLDHATMPTQERVPLL